MSLVINVLNNRIGTTNIPSIKFSSTSNFFLTMSSSPHANFQNRWNGEIFYSLDGVSWSNAENHSEFNTKQIYFYGLGNYSLVNSDLRFRIISTDRNGSVYCEGDIASLIDAATVLSGREPTICASCLEGLFSNCINLASAPKLSFKNLSEACYKRMFFECNKLATAPSLPAENLAVSCYEEMFWGCDSLIQSPALPASILPARCYNGMFWDCNNLSAVGEIAGSSIGYKSCENMFISCKSLIIPPRLPATTLSESCYSGMFANCTSLDRLPELRCTNIPSYAYMGMFSGCSNIDLSSSQSTNYQYLFRLPQSGTGTSGTYAFLYMFDNTKNPITVMNNTNYYTNNPLVT